MWPLGEHLGLVQANHRGPGFKSSCCPLSAILRFLAATSVPLSWEFCWVDIESAPLGQMEIAGQILSPFCGYVTVWYVCHAAAGGVASWGTSLGDTEVHHILGYQIHHMPLHGFFSLPLPPLTLVFRGSHSEYLYLALFWIQMRRDGIRLRGLHQGNINHACKTG